MLPTVKNQLLPVNSSYSSGLSARLWEVVEGRRHPSWQIPEQYPKYPTPSPDTPTNPSRYILPLSSRELPSPAEKTPVPLGVGPLLV